MEMVEIRRRASGFGSCGRVVLLSLLLLCCSLSLSAQAPLALSGTETQAAYAVDLKTGEVLFDYHGNRKLTPASITKLFSTGAALLQKSPNARIKTDIGLVRDAASLVVHGIFDPTVDSRYFNRNQLSQVADTLAERLRSLKMTHIASLTADLCLGLFAPYCSRRLWEDMGNYYGASPSALMADDNTVEVFYRSPAEANELCVIDSVVPSIGREPESFVRSYNGNSDLSNMYVAGSDLWYATGCIPQGRRAYGVKSAMPEPESHFMNKLAKLLRDRGIEIDAVVYKTERAEMPKDSTVMSLYSPEIKDIVTTTNTWSVNLFADALAMNMAAKWSHATWSGATESLKNFWAEKIGSKPSIFDGSGLSPMGSLSPKELTDLLGYMDKSDVSAEFYASLPILGKTGTLRNMGVQSILRGKVRAKSGSMTGVIAYAGYIEKEADRKIAFCIIVNHHSESTSTVRNAIVSWLTKLNSL